MTTSVTEVEPRWFRPKIAFEAIPRSNVRASFRKKKKEKKEEVAIPFEKTHRKDAAKLLAGTELRNVLFARR